MSFEDKEAELGFPPDENAERAEKTCMSSIKRSGSSSMS